MELRLPAVSSTVMTFNLRRASLWDGANAWRFRKRCAASAILGAAADIVGTQEARRPMLRQLADLLPGYAWVGEGRGRDRAGEHNAIFYRESEWAPESDGTFWLSDTPDRPGSRGWGARFPRICTWAVLRSKRSGSGSGCAPPRIVVCNTHLDHRSVEARMLGLDLAADRMNRLRRRYGAPAILLGDFNDSPRSEAVAQLGRQHDLASAYERCADDAGGVGATFHRFRGTPRGQTEPIDHIFVSPEWSLLSVAVDRSRYEGKFPSDHFPVVATISWEPRELRDMSRAAFSGR